MPEVAAGRAARTGFRFDINGLRAWAVVSVVLYHFGIPGVPGGFSGVDVFFVISGLLMCAIIVAALERDEFSIGHFYLARARRILPALIVLCAVALLFGWFLLMPEEYQQLGRHARDSVLFSSNLRYLKESGYFDVASQEKWLLHTWSLAVEWQFYMLLPLALMLVWKLLPGRRAVGVVLVVVFLASLGWCVWRTATAPSAAFFQIQSRAWEMLAGGLVYLASSRIRLSALRARLIEGLGFALIIATLVLFDKNSPWPGWRALLPVAGAALVLLAARQTSLWTGSAIAQWLGTRSYSIYLWHWPLMVALAYLEQSTDPWWISGGLLLTLLLGHLSYAFVEGPPRRYLAAMGASRAAVTVCLALAVLAVFAQQVRESGFPARLPEAVARVEAERNNHNPRQKECLNVDAGCVYGEEPVGAIMIGDSHADATVSALQASMPAGQGGILFKGGSGCVIAFGMKKTKVGGERLCESLNRHIEEEIVPAYPGIPIIVVGRTSGYVNGGHPSELDGQRPLFHFSRPADSYDEAFFEEFRAHYLDTMCQLARQHPLYIVRPIAEMSVPVPTAIGRSMLLGKPRDVSLPMAAYRHRHAFVRALQDEAAQRCGAHLLDPVPFMCDGQRCLGSLNGRPLYRDGDHLSEFGNRLLVPMFEPIFQDGTAASR